MSYDKFAEFYDLDLGNVEKDLKVYKQLIKENCSVLILSCGTGREITYLSDYCSEMAGVDLSENMLNVAKSKSYNKSVKFYLQDMCEFKVDKKYDYIIIPNNGILHLLDHESIEKCFQCSMESLTDSGKMLFDFFIPREGSSNNTLITDYHKYFKAIDKEVIRSRLVIKNQLSRIHKTKIFYEFISKDGSVEKKVVNYTLKGYYPDEMVLLARLSGFSVDNIYGNFDLESYNKDIHYHVFFELSKKEE